MISWEQAICKNLVLRAPRCCQISKLDTRQGHLERYRATSLYGVVSCKDTRVLQILIQQQEGRKGISTLHSSPMWVIFAIPLIKPLDQGQAYSLWAKFGLLPVFVNKILLVYMVSILLSWINHLS